jgi:hypothetical protein
MKTYFEGEFEADRNQQAGKRRTGIRRSRRAARSFPAIRFTITLPLLQLPAQRSRYTKLAIGVPGLIPESEPDLRRPECLVAAMQTAHLDEELGGLHDQPSSASRFTAGAAGFLTFSQWALRPDL